MALMGYMAYSRKTREQSHRMLIAFLSFTCLYAFADFLTFTAPAGDAAMFMARLGGSCIIVAAIFLCAFPETFRRDLKPFDWAVMTGFFMLAAPLWLGVIVGVRPRPWGWEAVYSPLAILFYSLVLNVLFVYAIYRMVLIARELKRDGAANARKVNNMTMGFVFFLVTGNVTNLLLGVGMGLGPPLYSTLLVVPVMVITFEFLRKG